MLLAGHIKPLAQRNEIRNTRCIVTLIIKKEIDVFTKTNTSGVRADSQYFYCMHVILYWSCKIYIIVQVNS
jgi:hypothetical protein